MKNLRYSPDYKEKLSVTRNWLDMRFGVKTRKDVMRKIKNRLTSLGQYPDSGISVRGMFGVDSDYEYIFVAHNYIFYYQDDRTIYITNLYHEREDFMYQLFGIKTVSDDDMP